jgi:hypothetical protein
MRSGEARPIWIWSKVSVFWTGLAKLVSSFIFSFPHEGKSVGRRKGALLVEGNIWSPYSAASAKAIRVILAYVVA